MEKALLFCQGLWYWAIDGEVSFPHFIQGAWRMASIVFAMYR